MSMASINILQYYKFIYIYIHTDNYIHETYLPSNFETNVAKELSVILSIPVCVCMFVRGCRNEMCKLFVPLSP